MTRQEHDWAEVVREWRSSGLSGSEFAKSVGVTASALRYWGSRLERAGEFKTEAPKSEAPPPVRIVPVVAAARRSPPPPAATISGRSQSERSPSPVVVHIGKVRIELREGFDRTAFAEVLSAVWELS
jgi:transposase-like protein